MFLEFYVFGERMVGWGGGGTKQFISFEGGGIKYFPTLLGGGGAKFYGRILEYPPPPQYRYFMTGPLLAKYSVWHTRASETRYFEKK